MNTSTNTSTNMKFGVMLSILVLAITAADLSTAGEPRSYIDSRSAADKNVLPFSGAVLAGDTLYISGSLGLKDGKVPDDPTEEARLVMDSIKRSVEAAGMSMDDLVSVQIFCSDVTHYQKFNDVYKTYFTKEYPARAFIGAGTLLFDARFEVVATAVRQ
jgi:2-iminobutanoate/2-iminopropanoate deaminase